MQVLIALDQLLNAMVGGWADETISSHAHRKWPRVAKVINALFFWQDDHCRQAYMSERLRLQNAPEFR